MKTRSIKYQLIYTYHSIHRTYQGKLRDRHVSPLEKPIQWPECEHESMRAPLA